MNIQKQAFTLVELIVVVTILAILSTIGFVSYSSYLTGVRDTNRVSNMKAISDGLELYRTKFSLPLPEDSVEVKANGIVIAYQGYAGVNVLESIEFSNSGKDPKNDIYYSYYLTKNKKYFQLMGFLEEEDNLQTSIFNQTKAVDYSILYPTVYGNKLGILTGTGVDLNVPIQEIASIISDGSLDIRTTVNHYIGYFNHGISLSGTGIAFNGIENSLSAGGVVSSCKTFLNKSSTDGAYLIAIKGYNPFGVYCDMTTDGGGWTLVLKADGNNQTFTYLSSYWTDTAVLNQSNFDYDTTEFKSQLFSIMPLEEVHLQIVTNGESKYASFDKSADSLLDVFSGGYQATDYGKDNWMNLVSGASMQPYCNMEGFNVEPATNYGAAKIGFISNNEDNCGTNDSSIGIGIEPRGTTYESSVGNNCGATLCSGGNSEINSFGYLYIR